MALPILVPIVLATLLEPGSTLLALRNGEDHRQGHDLLLVDELGLEDSAAALKPWGEEQLPGTQPESQARCEDAAEGSNCYEAVMYLKETGFRRHQDWYPGFTRHSLFQDVQALLNRTGKAKCPKPCAMTTDERTEMNAAGMSTQAVVAKITDKSCHGIEEVESEVAWERCRRAIVWMTTKGIAAHPDWYPNLSANSSREDVQEELYRQSKAACPRPCRPERDAPAPALLVAPAAPAENESQPLVAPAASAEDELKKYIKGLGAPAAPAENESRPLVAQAEGESQPDPAFKLVKDMTPDELKKYIKGEWDGNLATATADASEEAHAPEQAAPTDTSVEEQAVAGASEQAHAPEQAAPTDTSVEEQAVANVSEEAHVPEQAAPTDTLVEEQAVANVSEEAHAAIRDPLLDTEPLPMVDMDSALAAPFARNETGGAESEMAAETEAESEMATLRARWRREREVAAQTEADAIAPDNLSQEEPLPTIGEDGATADENLEAQPEAEAAKDPTDANPRMEINDSAQDEAAKMEAEGTWDMAGAKAMVGSETNATTEETKEAESNTSAEDEAAATNAEMMGGIADAKPQVESKTAARDEADADWEAKAMKYETDTMRGLDRADAKPQVETTTTTQDDPAAEMEKTDSYTSATYATAQPAEEATNATSQEMKDLESNTSAEDEAPATEDIDILDPMKDMLDAKHQVENATTAQNDMAADIEGEELKEMTAAKPQVEKNTTAHDEAYKPVKDMTPDRLKKYMKGEWDGNLATTTQDDMAAEIEGEELKEMTAAKPRVENNNTAQDDAYKPVKDMTPDELKKYMKGEWDGNRATTTQDDMAAEIEGEELKEMTAAKPQVEKNTTAQDDAYKPVKDMTPDELKKYMKGEWDGNLATTTQDVTAAEVEGEEVKDITAAKPRVERKTTAQDEVGREVEADSKDMGDARPQVETTANTQGDPAAEMEGDVPKDTTDAKQQAEGETSAQDDMGEMKGVMKDATQEESMKELMRGAKSQVESKTTAQEKWGKEMDAEVTKDMVDAKPQDEGETAAQDDITAEMVGVMKDAKPQVERKITAQEKMWEGIMADAKPQAEGETAAQDDVEGEMEELMKDAKPQVESKTIAHDEEGKVEAEVTKYMADAKPQAESKTTAQDDVEGHMEELMKAKPLVESTTIAQDDVEADMEELMKAKPPAMIMMK